jgi:hypothetical protein
MLDALLEAGYRRTLDAVFAIDVMVHVPLQDLVTYAITAALALRPGGKFIFTAADATSERGFTKLVGDIRWTYQDQRDPVGGQPLGAARFQWMSPQLVETVLERLGFTVQIDPGLHRDLWVVATLADSSRGDRFEAALRSTRARTLVHRP